MIYNLESTSRQTKQRKIWMSPGTTFHKVNFTLQDSSPVCSSLSWIFKRVHKAVTVSYTPEEPQAY